MEPSNHHLNKINEEEMISVNKLVKQHKIHNENKDFIVNIPEKLTSDKPQIIFKNNFTLEFIKTSIQTKFEEELYKFSKSELFFFIFLLACNFLGYFYYLCFKPNILNKSIIPQIETLSIIQIFLAGLSLLMYILKNIFKDNLIIAKLFKYIFLFFLSGVFSLGNNIISSFIEQSIICDYYFIINFVEFSVKISYFLVVDYEFLRIFIVHTTIIVISWSTYLTTRDINGGWILKASRLTLSYICLTILFYFYDKFYRKLFYLSKKIETQKDFYLNTLNSMKNGIFIYNIPKQKIKFINNYLNKYDEFTKIVPIPKLLNTIDDNGNNFIDINNRKYNIEDKFLNYNIFNHVIETNKNLPQEIINYMTLELFSESTDSIYKYFEENKENFPLDKSMYIGQIKLKEKGDENLFEFYLRHIQVEDSSYMEFMLNNVTYTKIHEIEKTKQKTQILARISHEFKNPLIVSSEVIEEIEDDIKIDENVRQNLKFLKNLSQYMLILVKDFEALSCLENNIDNIIYPVRFNLKDFTKEIQEIVEALIKKKNSINPLNFKIFIDEQLNYFITDNTRLKQILINLISNSIKFTEIGFIELKIERVDEVDANNRLLEDNLDIMYEEQLQTIKISIIDTGKGIPKERQQYLFDSGLKENSEDNMLGAGYGLGIVKNLCSMLGTNIQYSENNPKGSIFYFNLSEIRIEENESRCFKSKKKIKPKNENYDSYDINFQEKVDNFNFEFGNNQINQEEFENNQNNMINIPLSIPKLSLTEESKSNSSQRYIKTERKYFDINIQQNILKNYTNKMESKSKIYNYNII